MSEIDDLRKDIEAIDKDMAELFEKRMKIAYKIACYKREHGIQVLDKDREKALIEKNCGYIVDKELEPYYIDYLKDVMNVSKRYQHRLLEGVKVAYSGIEGSFASISANRILPDAERVSYKNFAEAYNAVVRGECELAVLPIENSYAGDVGPVTDLMFFGDLHVTGVYELRVSHCLLGVEGSSVSTVKTVISHPQALDQCHEYIRKHDYKAISAENTAIAAKEVADAGDLTVAAIASMQTADLYGLKVLDHDINESAENTTRFAVFSKSMGEVKEDDRFSTFILMFTVKNEAGTLAKAISIIGEYGYSMRVIRSRPLKDKNWQYYFYTEVEGRFSSDNGRKMLEELGRHCEFLKVVGTYRPDTRI